MPVMSGMDFLRALRDRAFAQRPKVVFCTTENGMAYIRAAIEAGADEYVMRSEEHTSELQSLMRISYAVFCLKKKKKKYTEQVERPIITHMTYHKRRVREKRT